MRAKLFRKILLAGSAVLAAVSFSSAAIAEIIAIPGTSISLDPPEGFSLSEQFSGFVNSEDFSSIIVTELPLEAYSEIATAFASADAATERFASQGIEIEEVSSITVGEMQAPLLKGVQRVEGLQVDKYIVLLRGDATILMVFNVVDRDRLSEGAVLAAIESVQVAATPSLEEQIAQLPFSFDVVAPFQVLQTLAGSGVAITLNGETDPSGQKPLVVIASSVGSAVEPDDLAAFAERLLRGTRGFANAEIIEQTPIDFAGGDGYLITATVPEGTISQYLRVPPNASYVRLIVSGEATEVEKLASEIQTIVRSVRIKAGE